MQERTRRQQRAARPDSAGGPFDDTEPVAGMATVAHGPYAERLPVAEMNVSEVRRRFQDRLDIHPEAIALIDGNPVDDTTRVGAGQMLMFVRPSGEKGGAPA
jgi:hypothetical protein